MFIMGRLTLCSALQGKWLFYNKQIHHWGCLSVIFVPLLLLHICRNVTQFLVFIFSTAGMLSSSGTNPVSQISSCNDDELGGH